jgi:Uma2 family endonuclease
VDVVLSEVDVVQPDVIVVCDPNKITERNIQGAPDWMAEVLSPSTARKDLREKKALFERAGVKEYVIFDPTQGWVQRFVLRDGIYGPGEILDPQESLILDFMPGEVLPLAEVFGVSMQPVSEDGQG